MPAKRSGPMVIGLLVVVLLILHQDNWFWDSDTLVFGFIPIGLFYHACLSIAASVVWFLATRIAWPEELIEETQAVVHKRQEGQQEEVRS